MPKAAVSALIPVIIPQIQRGTNDDGPPGTASGFLHEDSPPSTYILREDGSYLLRE